MEIDYKKCNVCGADKLLTSFVRNSGRCSQCRYEADKKRHNATLSGYLTMRLTALKRRHKNANYPGVPVSLGDLLKLYDDQRGICAITGIPMHYTHGHSDMSISPDRVDRDKGYEDGNVRLVCVRANLMRSTLDDEDFAWWCRAVVNNLGI